MKGFLGCEGKRNTSRERVTKMCLVKHVFVLNDE